MTPIDFDEELLGDLPPHELVTWARDQRPYQPLPTVVLEGPHGRVISRWQLTARLTWCARRSAATGRPAGETYHRGKRGTHQGVRRQDGVVPGDLT
jgi:hypothetical protein